MTRSTVTCECGAVYERTEVKFMMRDKDSYECSCGSTLESWNGSRIPQFRLISKPESAAGE